MFQHLVFRGHHVFQSLVSSTKISEQLSLFFGTAVYDHPETPVGPVKEGCDERTQILCGIGCKYDIEL